ncbi:unnamed protein product, partial [Sphacelaria rigidula]
MANRALADAMGTHADPAKSKEQACLAEIKKGVVEYLEKSAKMRQKTVKLVNDAPHRWLTSVNFLEVILSVWPVLRIRHRKKENTTFPPTGSEESIPQLFALVYPVSDAIKDSQGLLTWTAGKTVLNIAELLVGVLNPAASLTVSR